MEKIDGIRIADKIYHRIGCLKGRGIRTDVIMVGEDKATESFVSRKQVSANRIGIDFHIIRLPTNITTEDMVAVVRASSDNSCVTAVIVQLPLPSHIDRDRVLAEISPDKDADVLNGGKNISPAVHVILEIMNDLKKDIADLHFAVVGYGELVGKPAYQFLTKQARSVCLLRRGDNIERGVSDVDVIILGTGSPHLISADMISDEAIVIDFGYGLTPDGKLVGDFNPKPSNKNIRYTPVPGGTGPILVAKLFENIVALKQ